MLSSTVEILHTLEPRRMESPSPVAEARGVVPAPPTAVREDDDDDILRDVNQLMQCHWDHTAKITSILQCTSSFFVLLYQRMFEPFIQSNTFSSPKTQEQKLRNMEMVLIKLQQRQVDVSGISAAKVAQQDAGHIRQLIRLFVKINKELQLQKKAMGSAGYEMGAPSSWVRAQYNASTNSTPGVTFGTTPVGAAAVSPPYAHPVSTHHNMEEELQYIHGGDEDPHHTLRRGYTIAEVPVDDRHSPGGMFWSREPASSNGHHGYHEEEEDGDDPREAYVDQWRNEISLHPEPLPEVSMHDDTAEPSADRLTKVVVHDIVAADDRKDARPQALGRGRDDGVVRPSRTPLSRISRNKTHSTDEAKEGARKPNRKPQTVPHTHAKNAGARRRSAAAAVPAVEPALSQAEQRLFARHPYRCLDRAARDAKIEKLRATRFLRDMQQLLRQRIRQDYDEKMSDMRHSLREAEEREHRNKLEQMRELREYNEKYREAYATLVEAAARDPHIPRHIMSRETAELAAYYERALEEGRRMCRHLVAEQSGRKKSAIRRYADAALGWQSTVEETGAPVY